MYTKISELPDSFKNMTDEAKEKAMAMMNALLKKGMNEGMAIAITMKRVKEMDLAEELTASVNGKDHPAGDFAYVPDPGKPSTWKFPIFDKAHVANAVARLNQASIPEADLPGVKQRIRTAWKKHWPEKETGEMPKILLAEELPTEDLLNVEIARTGKVTDSRGRTVILTEEDFDLAEQSWKAIGDKVVKAPVDITLPYKLWAGHDASQPILASDGMIAGGWVTNVRREGQKLMADFMRVPGKIAKLIEAGAWRTVSIGLRPTFEFAGKTYRNVLDHVALLGKKAPAIKGMDDLLALYSGTEDKDLLALLSDEDLTVIVLSEDVGNPTRKEGVNMEKLLEMLRKKFGLAEDAGEDDIIGAFAEFDKGGTEAITAVATLTAEVEELKKGKNESGNVELSEDRYDELVEMAQMGKKALEGLVRKGREDMVDQAIRAKKILPSERDHFIGLAEADEAKVQALLAAKKPMTHLTGAMGSEEEAPESVELTEAERQVAKRLGVSEDSLMKSKDPETFERMQKAKGEEE